MVYSKTFAGYYDSLMGDYTRLIQTVHSLTNSYSPKKKKLRILELACGTGTILQSFPITYELYGLDIAKDMIEIAKKKVPSAHLRVEDMTHFAYTQKFDVILCVFDSINHLPKFSEWKKVFYLVSKHLTRNGLFIFDMNTPRRLQKITTFPPVITKLHKTTICFEKLHRITKNTYNLQIIIIKDSHKPQPQVVEEYITESVFEKKKVMGALKKYFTIKKMIDPFRKRITTNTGRIFFACKISTRTYSL